MRRCGITLIGLVGTLVFCMDAGAVAPGPSSNRFGGIAERNVFGLKSSEPAPEAAVQKAPPPKIILTGITTLLGNKLALMKALLPAKPGEPAKEQALMLTEGQRDGAIEVLEINEHARSVKVNDYGTVMTLTFEKDGLKPPAPAAPGVGSAGFMSSSGSIPAPGAAPTNGYAPPGGLNTRMRVLPTRMPRSTTMQGASAPTTDGVNPSSAVTGTVPSPTGRVLESNAAPVSAEAQNQMSQDEQMQLLELQREIDRMTPSYPPSSTAPPTPSGPYPTMPPGNYAPGVLPPGANMQRTAPPYLPQ